MKKELSGWSRRPLCSLVWVSSSGSGVKLFRIYTMSSLPCIDNPEDQWQHYCCRHHYKPNVDPLAMSSQARTVLVAYVCECLPDKSTVLQLNQEWTITVQTITHIHRSCHLAVDGGSQPTSCGANTSWVDLTNIILPNLHKTKMKILFVTSGKLCEGEGKG